MRTKLIEIDSCSHCTYSGFDSALRSRFCFFDSIKVDEKEEIPQTCRLQDKETKWYEKDIRPFHVALNCLIWSKEGFDIGYWDEQSKVWRTKWGRRIEIIRWSHLPVPPKQEG